MNNTQVAFDLSQSTKKVKKNNDFPVNSLPDAIPLIPQQPLSVWLVGFWIVVNSRFWLGHYGREEKEIDLRSFAHHQSKRETDQ